LFSENPLTGLHRPPSQRLGPELPIPPASPCGALRRDCARAALAQSKHVFNFHDRGPIVLYSYSMQAGNRYFSCFMNCMIGVALAPSRQYWDRWVHLRCGRTRSSCTVPQKARPSWWMQPCNSRSRPWLPRISRLRPPIHFLGSHVAIGIVHAERHMRTREHLFTGPRSSPPGGWTI
jgi:hypothetical protein